MCSKHLIGGGLGLLVLAVGLWAPSTVVAPSIQRAVGLVGFAIIFWTAEPIPVEVSSLLLLLLLPASGLLSFEQAFAPFAGKTVWLLFAGMVLSLGIAESGLGHRLAATGLDRVGGSPARLLAGLHVMGLAAAFLIPSGVVRLLLLIPIGTAMVDGMAGRRDPQLNAAVHLSLLCSTYYGGSGILTGSVPNLVVAGQLEQVTGRMVYWGEWLQWMFPVTGLLRTGLSFLVIWLLLGRRLAPDCIRRSHAPTPGEPLSASQQRILAILILGVALWASDVVHHVAPVYVALLLVLFQTWPGRGALPVTELRKLNFAFLFYVAALFSLGTALEVSGFNAIAIARVTRLVDLSAFDWFGRQLAIILLTVPFDFLMDVAVVGGVATPAMLDLGRIHQMDGLAVAMSVALATGQAFLPYQAAPFMVAYSFRRLSMGQLVLTMMCISGLSLALLCPLCLLYWRWLGLI